MQPPNPHLSDPYAANRHHHTAQYYSHFPTQNPNPYPLHQHHQLQIESQFSNAAINPDPPGAETYFPAYSINHAGGAFNAHHAGAATYSQVIGAAAAALPYAGELMVRNWPTEESVQQYGNPLYATGEMVPQDASQHLLPAAPPRAIWNPTVHTRGTWKKTKPPKKTKIAQSAWCEICKVECNTKDVLYNHKLGKKHLKNLEKLNSAITVTPTPTPTPAPAPVPAPAPARAAPIIGPLENPKNGNSGQKKKAETPEDLEMKRRKVLEGGAAANAVRTCTLCNVVCNSDTVFRFHLAGQKHLSMLKKSQQAVAT